jgi:hypothetical protein
MSGTLTTSITGIILEARSILNDTVQTAGAAYRYADTDLLANLNAAVREARTKRPDLFLSFGLRTTLPLFQETDVEAGTPWPFDLSLYDPCLYYIVGRAELREDTFTNDARATTLMNKFVSQLLTLAS